MNKSVSVVLALIALVCGLGFFFGEEKSWIFWSVRAWFEDEEGR